MVDFYIIPLSRKLRDCGVFGVSSDENLSYATQNREEWISRGQEIVAEMVEQVEIEFKDLPLPPSAVVETSGVNHETKAGDTENDIGEDDKTEKPELEDS